MHIRDCLKGTRIRVRITRYDREDAKHNGQPEPTVGREYVLLDNYWNRRSRLASFGGAGAAVIATIDISEAFVPDLSIVKGHWELVELTVAQQKQLRMQRHLEYVTSPESETYWCS